MESAESVGTDEENAVPTTTPSCAGKILRYLSYLSGSGIFYFRFRSQLVAGFTYSIHNVRYVGVHLREHFFSDRYVPYKTLTCN